MPSATAITALHIRRAVTTAGGDVAKLPPIDENLRFEDRIAIDDLIAMWERAAELTGRRDLPAIAAEYASHDERSLLAFVVSNRPTFGDAMDHYVRWFPAVSDAYGWRIEPDGDLVRLVASPPGPIDRLGWQLHCEFEIVDSVRSAAAVTAHRAIPTAIDFMHPAPAADTVAKLARLAGITPRFEARRCEIVYPVAARDVELPHARPALATVVLERLAAMLTAIERDGAIGLRVRSAIGDRIERGASCDVDAIAGALGMSRRSLERALVTQGTSVGELLDDERKQRAIAWLPTLSVETVAARLGYSDRRAFARAFRRWTQLAPSEVRKKARR